MPDARRRARHIRENLRRGYAQQPGGLPRVGGQHMRRPVRQPGGPPGQQVERIRVQHAGQRTPVQKSKQPLHQRGGHRPLPQPAARAQRVRALQRRREGLPGGVLILCGQRGAGGAGAERLHHVHHIVRAGHRYQPRARAQGRRRGDGRGPCHTPASGPEHHAAQLSLVRGARTRKQQAVASFQHAHAVRVVQRRGLRSGETDIRHGDLPGVIRPLSQIQPRLGPVEGDRLARADRRAHDLPRLAVQPRRNVHRHHGHACLRQRLERLAGRARRALQRARQARAEQRVDCAGDLFRHGKISLHAVHGNVRRASRRLRQAVQLALCVRAQAAGQQPAFAPKGRVLLHQDAHGRQAVASIVARAAQADHLPRAPGRLSAYRPRHMRRGVLHERFAREGRLLHHAGFHPLHLRRCDGAQHAPSPFCYSITHTAAAMPASCVRLKNARSAPSSPSRACAAPVRR